MKVSEIIHAVRVGMGDVGQTKLSQYEMADNFNAVLRIVNNLLCNISSSLVEQSVSLTLAGGSTPLPTNFREAKRVIGINELISTTGDVDAYTFRIIGNALYASGDSVTLEYKADFTPVITDGIGFAPDDLPLPYGFFDLLVRAVKGLIDGTLTQDAITSLVRQEVVGLTARRDRTRNVRKLVF